MVDGSHVDPEGQIAAVREVFAEIGADKVPEVIVINKADLADPMVIARLRQREPHSVVVSAKTGEGIDDVLRLVEDELPRPGVEFEALVPYARGDLLDRLHREGEIDSHRAHRRRHASHRPRHRGAGRRARVVRRVGRRSLVLNQRASPSRAVDIRGLSREGGGTVSSREEPHARTHHVPLRRPGPGRGGCARRTR